ncbi:diguanylate cyclase [Vibrio sp. RE86]|uniref:GGDEF domain-containing protein n=1 Tax=Vibrio sp. RE86 TaxID=2607605 RepID=UPI0014933A61|nr:sensor domain-containing diguanylate cyclase [Vibrio sp. RE86]NOH79253.1 diguanylate cyclase [Vibrio sp. RE86]
MQVQRHFSLKFVFLMPLFLVLLVFLLTTRNYYDSLIRDVDDEYSRIFAAMERASKVITAIDYSFSNYAKSHYIMMLEHNRQVVDGLCQMWPIDLMLLSEGRNHDIPAVDINYMLIGDEQLCDPESEEFQRISGQVSLAPVLSFLHDIDSYLLGIHYIDREGYFMSSPDTYAKNVTKELLTTLKARPFWQETAINKDHVTLSGPAPVNASNTEVMSLSMPIYSEGVHQGMLSLDISYGELLDTSGKLTGRLHIVDTDYLTPSSHTLLIRPLSIEGVVGSHSIYYQFDWMTEVKSFFYFERYSLMVIALIYLFSVIVLFFINTRVEHDYFKDLAAKDPMTGLLNRRGLEAFLSNAVHGQYIAIAVFDIDNFKSINDRFGHDVGDNVIIYMADQIDVSIRRNDAAARVGGEEFVIYMTGNDKAMLQKGMLRVQNAINEDSARAIDAGFTISGGVEIVESSAGCSFERLFKAADEKLYQAKTTGKDKLVF